VLEVYCIPALCSFQDIDSSYRIAFTAMKSKAQDHHANASSVSFSIANPLGSVLVRFQIT
jgi:hypothetical protein